MVYSRDIRNVAISHIPFLIEFDSNIVFKMMFCDCFSIGCDSIYKTSIPFYNKDKSIGKREEILCYIRKMMQNS